MQPSDYLHPKFQLRVYLVLTDRFGIKRSTRHGSDLSVSAAPPSGFASGRLFLIHVASAHLQLLG